MDSGRVEILNNQFVGYLDNFQRKTNGGGVTNNLEPEALNVFNDNMVNIDDINNVRASNYGCY